MIKVRRLVEDFSELGEAEFVRAIADWCGVPWDEIDVGMGVYDMNLLRYSLPMDVEIEDGLIVEVDYITVGQRDGMELARILASV